MYRVRDNSRSKAFISRPTSPTLEIGAKQGVTRLPILDDLISDVLRAETIPR